MKWLLKDNQAQSPLSIRVKSEQREILDAHSSLSLLFYYIRQEIHSMKTTVKIGGVPEHFNYPWHKAIEEGKFAQHQIDLQWTDYPGGTGALVQDLTDKKLHVV